MRVRVVQMCLGHDMATNIAHARTLVDAASVERPDIVSLPETWSCRGGNRETHFLGAEEMPVTGVSGLGGAAYEFLRRTAARIKAIVHRGSIAEKSIGCEAGRLFDTTLVFDPLGHETLNTGQAA